MATKCACNDPAPGAPPGGLRAQQLDWEEDISLQCQWLSGEDAAAVERFDVVLSSDIVYATQHAEMVPAVIATRLEKHEGARSLMIMGIRGTMWQMIDHGSPTYLVDRLLEEFASHNLGYAAFFVELVGNEKDKREQPDAPPGCKIPKLDELLSIFSNGPPPKKNFSEDIPAVDDNCIAIVNWHAEFS
eukprot:CAMPEP_0196580434 /NCGR_PEP_ID=MMETSP1081-20130531/28627_1 /TAXON_ID=36882 /ORGANISM="Pyramimonas amylifera, Strain CCMP720" /LENGTH=187 /DNA_ID=CAMNT_0041900297 /DNA_START=461 /DNA_END=1024 /DNA_ORIENTATION=+